MAVKFALLAVTIVFSISTGNVDAACSDATKCAEILRVPEASVVTEVALDSLCGSVGAFKTCVDGVTDCPSSDPMHMMIIGLVGAANAFTYACTTEVRKVIKNSETCVASAESRSNTSSCGDIKTVIGRGQDMCTSVNTYLKCMHDWMGAQCDMNVAGVQTLIVAKTMQPLMDTMSCTIQTSYVRTTSGARVTSASMLSVFGVVCLTLIGLFRN